MGTSVPRAVVVRASPTTRVSRASPAETRAKAAPSPIDQRDRPPGGGQLQGPAPDLLQVQLVAGQEHQEGEPQVGQAGHASLLTWARSST